MRSLAIAIVTLAAAVGSLLLLDRVNPPPVTVDPGVAAVDSTKRGRLLILHVDSWRYETAIDSTLMPQVARLRKQGASWEVQTVFEGFTVPAVRAAFSGRAETQLVNLIQNFQFRALPIESFFRDASRIGKRTLIVAVEPFTQFGDYFVQRFPVARGLDMYAADRLRPAMALNGFRNEAFDIVVCHYESADWVAHETGIGTERYKREFAYADSLVAAFAAARGPNDYLLAYGDHGHSPTGEHKTGIHIPTFALLLGPDVRAGVIAPPMAMFNLRYIASHTMGITLRAAPYDTEQMARFLPIAADSATDSATDSAADSAVAAALPSRGPSRRAVDYVMALIVLVGGVLLARWLSRSVDGPPAHASPFLLIAGIFGAELVIQRWVWPGFSLFPAGTITAVPSSLLTLIPLYICAIGSKLGVLVAIAGRARWRSAVAWTAAIAVVELRVWDSPIAYAALLVAGSAALWTSRDAGARRVATIAILSALIYFTLRLSLFQLAWIDIFLGALWLLARRRDNAWVDALIVCGAYALTAGWLASSLEWGFLYTLFPAHLVELQVQYFVPFILAKLPLLLVLALVIAGRRPTRRFVQVLLAYTGLRFATAWMLRLGGASGADVWPLAEQGIYLTTFVIAAVVWGSQRQTPAMPAQSAAPA